MSNFEPQNLREAMIVIQEIDIQPGDVVYADYIMACDRPFKPAPWVLVGYEQHPASNFKTWVFKMVRQNERHTTA